MLILLPKSFFKLCNSSLIIESIRLRTSMWMQSEQWRLNQRDVRESVQLVISKNYAETIIDLRLSEHW